MTCIQKKNILFFHDKKPDEVIPGFIQNDIDILSKKYNVKVISIYNYGSLYYKALFDIKIWKNIYHSDLVFIWFGFLGIISIMSKLLFKPAIIVSGGADVFIQEEYGYKSDWKAKLRIFFYILGYRAAKVNLVVSNSSLQEFKKLFLTKSNYKVIPNVVDTKHFNRGDAVKKGQIITITIINERSFVRKGLSTYIETARLVPDVTFKIGGYVEDELIAKKIKEIAPSNVIFLGSLTKEELLKEYQSSLIYAQLSLHEGFGVAMAEAMACECIPLVTNRGAMPEVVGDAGFIVEAENPKETASRIKEILSQECSQLSKNARKRIVDNYAYDVREKELYNLIDSIITSSF